MGIVTETETIKTGQKDYSVTLGYGIIAVTLAFASNFFGGMISTLMSTYLPVSVRDLLGSMSAEQVSNVGAWVGSVFLLGWTLGGFSLGWLGDRLGRVRTFTASIVIFGIFTLAVSWAPDWQLLVGFRFMAGLGIGATLVLSNVLVAEIWGARSKGRAVAISIVAVGFPIGIIASGIVSYLLPDWRSAFLVGFLPLFLALLCQWLLKEPEQWMEIHHKMSLSGRKSDAFSVFHRLLATDIRTDFIIGTTIFGAMLVGMWAAFTWLPAWAQNLIGTETAGQEEGGILLMLMGSGGIAGCIFAGFLANSLGRRGALLLSFAGAFIAAALLFWTNPSFTPVIYFETAFLAIFFGISQGILAVYIPELFPTAVRSTATGIGFNAGRLVTAAAVFFVGILVPVLGGYSNALLVFSLTYAIGFIVTWFGRETKGSTL